MNRLQQSENEESSRDREITLAPCEHRVKIVEIIEVSESQLNRTFIM